jgi:Activator of Hsp90 ATPase homolog 1-like protein
VEGEGTVGDVGLPYRLERDDGWEVNGAVLAKEPLHRLRVTWQVKTPPEFVMPNCEVEFLIEPASIFETSSRTKLTVNSYVDGPIPQPFLNAGRTGWAMITRNLKEYLDQTS